MGRKISDVVGLFFVFCVGVLTLVCLLGVWDFIEGDVILKTLATVGIIAFASVISLFASKSMGNGDEGANEISPYLPLFTSLRYFTSTLLIVSVAILALVGIMSIWDLITDKDVITKTVVSMVILAFSSFIVITTCASRENRTIFGKVKEGNGHMSVAGIIVLLLIGVWLLPVLLAIVR